MFLNACSNRGAPAFRQVARPRRRGHRPVSRSGYAGHVERFEVRGTHDACVRLSLAIAIMRWLDREAGTSGHNLGVANVERLV